MKVEMSDIPKTNVPPWILTQPAFQQCVEEAISIREFRENFDRLNEYKTNISLRGSPIELKIDEASGRLEDSMRQFINFVYEFIYSRLPDNCFGYR